MEQLYASQSQPVCKAALGVARDRDRVKVQSRRKYVFTDQIDQLIREIYLNHRDAKTRPGIRLLAKKVGMPHWALKKRARELGLARTKELPWTEAELGILARYAWMSDERIRLKLKAAGYARTVPTRESRRPRCLPAISISFQEEITCKKRPLSSRSSQLDF